MARAKKHSVVWTICYAVNDESCEDGFYTATWFAYGKTKEVAKERFLQEKRMEEQFCGGIPADRFVVVNVIEGFSC